MWCAPYEAVGYERCEYCYSTICGWALGRPTCRPHTSSPLSGSFSAVLPKLGTRLGERDVDSLQKRESVWTVSTLFLFFLLSLYTPSFYPFPSLAQLPFSFPFPTLLPFSPFSPRLCSRSSFTFPSPSLPSPLPHSCSSFSFPLPLLPRSLAYPPTPTPSISPLPLSTAPPPSFVTHRCPLSRPPAAT